jgi:hypothetical protein
MSQSRTQQLIDTLWPESMPARMSVCVILDAARDQRIYGGVEGTSLNKCCLYRGDLPWQLQMAAPYLVELYPDDRFTRWLLNLGWGQSWGVFLRSESSMESLRKHFRQFLIVRDEAGRRLLFRYYDPRVLRVFLPTCDAVQLRSMFGPLQAYFMEAEEPSSAYEFQFDGRKLKQTSVTFETATAAQNTSP